MPKSNLYVLIIIIDRSKTEELLSFLMNNKDVNFLNVLQGVGTAKSDLLEVLGIGNDEKSVICCTLYENRLKSVYETLTCDFGFLHKGNGIAFTVPINSVGGPASLYLLSKVK